MKNLKTIETKKIIGSLNQFEDFELGTFQINPKISLERQRTHQGRLSKIEERYNAKKTIHLLPDDNFSDSTMYVEVLNIEDWYFVFGDGNHRVLFAKKYKIPEIVVREYHLNSLSSELKMNLWNNLNNILGFYENISRYPKNSDLNRIVELFILFLNKRIRNNDS